MPPTSGHLTQRPVLVTGAAGFVGRHVAERLVHQGLPVLAMIRPGRRGSSPWADPAVRRDVPAPTLLECDLLDRAGVSRLVESHRPVSCLHLAWDVASDGYKDSLKNLEYTGASLHLAQCLMRRNCQWIGFAGTHSEPSELCDPMNRYAAAKATLRNRVFDVNRAYPATRVGWFHLFPVYGPHDRPGRMIPSMIGAARAGESFALRCPHALRDFIHVHDVAAALALACDLRTTGRYDVGTGRVWPLHEIRTMVESLVGFRPPRANEDAAEQEAGARVRPRFGANRVADIDALLDGAGWKASISLPEGLESLVQKSASAAAL